MNRMQSEGQGQRCGRIERRIESARERERQNDKPDSSICGAATNAAIRENTTAASLQKMQNQAGNCQKIPTNLQEQSRTIS